VAPEVFQRTGHGVDRAGGQFDHGHGSATLAHRDGGQTIGPAGVQQTVLGQGSGGNDPDDVAVDHGLGAALAGHGRGFQLFADRGLEPLPDQPRQIAVQGMDRHPGHGDVLALVFTPFGQGDAEGPGGDLRVLEEQFVEIAHAEEDDGVRLAGLGRQELRHDRRRPLA
jgi:hypothetical protein